MRIIAGTFGSRKLATPPGLGTRPPSDFLRGSVFNILRESLDGAAALDLFAGCGSFGLEALSRGASSCVFVERDAAALRALRENIAALGLENCASVFSADVFAAAERLARDEKSFNLIFCDPPFSFGRDLAMKSRVAALIGKSLAGPLLAPGGIFLIRIEGKEEWAGALPAAAHDVRAYGRSEVHFFTRLS